LPGGSGGGSPERHPGPIGTKPSTAAHGPGRALPRAAGGGPITGLTCGSRPARPTQLLRPARARAAPYPAEISLRRRAGNPARGIGLRRPYRLTGHGSAGRVGT
jgi:hypothetical protein